MTLVHGITMDVRRLPLAVLAFFYCPNADMALRIDTNLRKAVQT